MKIGLIDVDSHNFPNLALMKLSAYHKGRGDSVEWWNGLKHYDVVYKSVETYEKLKQIRPLLKKRNREVRVYVLTNFNTTHEQDLERVKLLKALGYDPFIMIYNKPTAPKITVSLQRFVNNKYVFYSVNDFNDYDYKREQ